MRDSLARQQGGGDAHPDADLLTAFAEGSATVRERETVLAHLAACADCRKVLSLALPEATTQNVAALEHAGFALKRWARGWMWVPTLAAVAVVAISASLLLNREQKQMATETAGVARQQKDAVAEPAKSSPAARESSVQPPSASTHRSPINEPPIAAEADAAKVTERARRDEKQEVASSEAKAKDRAATQLAKRAETEKVTSAGAVHGAVSSAPPPPAYGAAQQTVEVTSAAPLVNVNPANAPAAMPAQPTRKPAASDYRSMGGVIGGTVNSAARSGPFAKNQNTQNQNTASNTANTVPRETAKKESAATPAPPPPVPSTAESTDATTSMVDATMRASWRIDVDGRLLRSIGASSYTPVISDPQAIFRAVSVNGTDIWVGGNAGALYHSTDNGANWTRVDVLDGGKKVIANIIGVRFRNALSGAVKTDSGQSWTTADGGALWIKSAVH